MHFSTKYRFFAALLSLATAAGAVRAASPADLQAIVGDGQSAAPGAPYPLALVARVTDAEGAPVAGAEVLFQVNFCYEVPGGSSCPGTSAYPVFAGGEYGAAVTSDADGRAVAPPLTAGLGSGPFEVYATVYPDDSGVVIAHAYFSLEQTGDAARVPITPAFTGTWYDPAQSGHGLFVEVLPENRLVAYWFTFAPDGSQAWFGGVGDIAGEAAVVYAHEGRGGAWIPAFDPSRFTPEPWGTLTLAFADCNHGRVDFVAYGSGSAWGSGHMDLTRLTQPAGLACP